LRYSKARLFSLSALTLCEFPLRDQPLQFLDLGRVGHLLDLEARTHPERRETFGVPTGPLVAIRHSLLGLDGEVGGLRNRKPKENPATRARCVRPGKGGRLDQTSVAAERTPDRLSFRGA
jgi:hypothetical protein